MNDFLPSARLEVEGDSGVSRVRAMSTHDLLFLLACRKYADSGGRSGLGALLGISAPGGIQARVSSPDFGFSTCHGQIECFANELYLL